MSAWRELAEARRGRKLTTAERDFDLDDDADGDDDLAVTPPDVVAALGFDPIDELGPQEALGAGVPHKHAQDGSIPSPATRLEAAKEKMRARAEVGL